MRRIIAAVSTLVLIMLAGVFAVPVAQAGDPCFHDTSRPPVTEGSVTTVKIDTCVFLPTIARVPVGATVRFVNSGGIEHQVTGANLTWGITGDKRLGNGDEFSAPFLKAGVYPYSVHDPSRDDRRDHRRLRRGFGWRKSRHRGGSSAATCG